jgi:DnaK suppressor protein
MPTKRDAMLRALLLDVRNSASDELHRLKTGIRQTTDSRRAVGDVYDDLSHESDLATIAARIDAATQRFRQAVDALRKMGSNDGSYGVCADCGDEISERRLRAVPFATRCLPCQQSAEDRPKLGRRSTGAHLTA